MMKVEIKRVGEKKFEEVPEVVSFGLDHVGLILHHPNRRQSGYPYHEVEEYKVSATITEVQKKSSLKAFGGT